MIIGWQIIRDDRNILQMCITNESSPVKDRSRERGHKKEVYRPINSNKHNLPLSFLSRKLVTKTIFAI